MKKRCSLVFIITILLFILAACGNETDSVSTPPTINVSEPSDIGMPQAEAGEQALPPQNNSVDTAEANVTEVIETPPVVATPTPEPEIVVETIYISNESELRTMVANASNTPIIAVLTTDVELISDFIIPGGVEITFVSDGNDIASQFNNGNVPK